MPIYAYRCDVCGFRKDALQKMSDPALTTCPSCSSRTSHPSPADSLIVNRRTCPACRNSLMNI